MSGQESRLLGRWGEEVAADYLRRKGYRLLAANWRCRFGELDLVAENRQFLCFVEVKLRKNSAFGGAGAAVTAAKQERLRTAAMLFLTQNPSNKQPRFDVIELYAPQGTDTRKPTVRHLENAF